MKGTLWKMVGAWPWNHNSRLWEMIQQMVLTSIEHSNTTTEQLRCNVNKQLPDWALFEAKWSRLETIPRRRWWRLAFYFAALRQPDGPPWWRTANRTIIQCEKLTKTSMLMMMTGVRMAQGFYLKKWYLTTSHIGGVNWNLSKMGVLLLVCLIQLKLNCIPS